MIEWHKSILQDVGSQFGTPSYVYFLDGIQQRFASVRSTFQGRFGISFAVKCNPNLELLRRIKRHTDTLDVSSIGEVDRALAAGYSPSALSFSGPAKRQDEGGQLHARRIGLGCPGLPCVLQSRSGIVDSDDRALWNNILFR